MMKRIPIYILSLLLIFSSSCEDFLDVNQDPNNQDEVDIKFLLPYGISSAAYVIGGRYQVLGALWSQHWTQSIGAGQYEGLDSYDISSSTFGREFSELYAGALKNFEEIKVRSKATDDWNYYLMATVMQCYIYQVLADLYNKIPLSDALLGNQENFTPKYDNGAAVYDTLIARLDYVMSIDYDEYDEMEEAEDADVLFAGDIDDWLGFAKNLKLKIFLRQCYSRPEVAENGIRDLFEDKDISFYNDNDVYYSEFSDEASKRNPLYETEVIFLGNNPNLILSNTLRLFLQNNADYDRLDVMFNTPEAGGGHVGQDQGDYNNPDEPTGSNSAYFSKPVLHPLYPVFLMSLSELYFMKAEAMIRYGIESYNDAKEMYELGVEAAYQRYGLTNGEDFYGAGGPYAFPTEVSPFEEFLKTITMQKWVAMVNFQGLEAFFETNRTHYPEVSRVDTENDNYETGQFTISVNNVTSGRLPKRLIFPEDEYTSNPNTPEEKPVYAKVWWDTKIDVID